MHKEDNITGIRVTTKTKTRLKKLYPRFCGFEDTMDDLVQKMLKICENAKDEEVVEITRRVK